jgi:hypothetical protein
MGALLRWAKDERAFVLDEPVTNTALNALSNSSVSCEAELRRLLLQCAENPSVLQDLIDCAELSSVAGFSEAGRVLYDVIFIWKGFSPSSIQAQVEIAARTHLWSDDGIPRLPTPLSSLPALSIDIAATELKHAFSLPLETPPLPKQGSNLVNSTCAQAVDLNTQILAQNQSAHDLNVFLLQFTELCDSLCRALTQPSNEQNWQITERLLVHLQKDVLDKPFFNLMAHNSIEIGRLAILLAFNSLKTFLTVNQDLAYGPFGSAGIFHSASQFEGAGLGPYFNHTSSLFRNGREILALIRRAAGMEPNSVFDADFLERWSYFLSMHVHGQALKEIVDVLGDRDLMRAIWGIYARMARRQGIRPDRGVLWHVRDAGIDNGDMQLALCAQKLIAQWWVEDKAEWTILGDLEATAGDYGQAERAYLYVLNLDSGDQNARKRLDALREGSFEDFTITCGFGTSGFRKMLRLRRRTAKAIRAIERSLKEEPISVKE